MNSQTKTNKRILALDILRGVTIAGMIMVNNPGTWGHIYAPLRHAEWNGLTPTDLVFPFFMFIMLFPFFCERGRDGEVRPAGVKATTCTAGKAGFDLPLTEPDRFLTRLDANAMVCALFREGSWTDEGSDCRRQRQSR